MNEKNFYSVAAILTALVSIGNIVAPVQMHTMWGISADANVAYMSHRWGWLALASAIVIWQGRNHPDFYQTINLSIAIAGIAQSMYIVLGMLNGSLSNFGWVSAAIEMAFGIGFLYLYLRGRGQPQPA